MGRPSEYKALRLAQDAVDVVLARWKREGVVKAAGMRAVAARTGASFEIVRNAFQGLTPDARVTAELLKMSGLAPDETTQRACLRCGEMFASEGAHNRLCDDCRERGDDDAEFDLNEDDVDVLTDALDCDSILE